MKNNINSSLLKIVVSVFLLLYPTISFAGYGSKKIAFFEGLISNIITNPIVIEAVRIQNKDNIELSTVDIISLDKKWKREKEEGIGNIINKVLMNNMSAFIKSEKIIKKGLITEVIIMDNKGLNVGISDITSDYWQGDEDKWRKTYLNENRRIFIDEVSFDESTQLFSVQISKSIVDPDTNKNIGAITIGINALDLEKME